MTREEHIAIVRRRARVEVRCRARGGRSLDPEQVAARVGGAWWTGSGVDVYARDGVEVRERFEVCCEHWPDPRTDILAAVHEALADLASECGEAAAS